jgi:hypothetical protein
MIALTAKNWMKTTISRSRPLSRKSRAFSTSAVARDIS